MIKLTDIKCIIWDLDDTFWTGTLSEGDVALIKENVDFLIETTEIGIIHSICSKNDFEAAKKKISVEDLIDRKSKAYTKLYMDYIDEAKREPTLFENPELFATPIVRNGKEFTLGFCPDIWKTWE